MLKGRVGKYISICALALLIFSFADSALAESLSLNSLIEEALQHNPQIKAAQYRLEASKARVTLLRSLEDPRIEYEYDKITASMDAVMRGTTAPMRTFAVSQDDSLHWRVNFFF